MLVSVAGLVLAIPLAQRYGIAGAASATVFIEFGMALFVVPISLAATDDHLMAFCRSMARFPEYLWLRDSGAR